MKLSEMIAQAQKILAQHGDLEVWAKDGGYGCGEYVPMKEVAYIPDRQYPREVVPEHISIET
jgi:hypothetical protein